MTRQEFVHAAHTDLSYSIEDIDAALSRAFAVSPEKQTYTPHDVQALAISIRLRAMYQSQEESYEE